MNLNECKYSRPVDVACYLDSAGSVHTNELTAALINALNRVANIEEELRSLRLQNPQWDGDL